MSTTATYLETLRRIPDDIVLSMATREIAPWDCSSCLCGWAIREDLARAAGCDADEVDVPQSDVPIDCTDVFGGTYEEWTVLFGDITDPSSGVERAFVTRVMEAAGVAS